MKVLNVLVDCEFSGIVREAFRALGHNAWSCDLEPAEDGSPYHILGDAIQAAYLGHHDGDANFTSVTYGHRSAWDLMIAHPPCTRLTNAGARWWKGREQEQAEALDFVRKLMAAPIPKIAVENPPGKIGTAIRPADQYIEPWQFGHPETKKTGLWLKNLPKLVPTNIVHEEMMAFPLAQRSRIHWMPPSANRAKDRSRTYPGIAQAMADQWSK